MFGLLGKYQETVAVVHAACRPQVRKTLHHFLVGGAAWRGCTTIRGSLVEVLEW